MASIESKNYRKLIVKNNADVNVPISILRQEWESFALTIKLPDNINIEQKDIENIHTEWISIEKQKNKKVILYFHGGGYTTGSCITHRELASKLARSSERTVILFNYSLSPENKFPKAILDSKKIYLWLCQNYTDAKNIVFGGDSSGGGLALTTVISLRDNNVFLPSSVFLISPWIDLNCTGESYKTRKEIDPMLTYEDLKKNSKEYLGTSKIEIELASPLSMCLKNLPPIHIIVGDHEIILSDSIRLSEKLKFNNSKVSLKVWDEMWHVWLAWDMPESDKAMIEIREFIKENENLFIP
jgi:acetyl esterase/lipase